MIRQARRFLAALAAITLVLLWAPAAVLPASASPVPTFEIDGNKTVDTAGNLDWSSSAVGTQPVEDDNVGGDPTVYSASSKESNDPSTWSIAGGAPPKDDISKVYAYAQPGTANVFFGFDRGATSGTDFYYVELNKAQPTNTTTFAPNRSIGDLRFKIYEQGNGAISLITESTWNGSSWDDTTLSSNPDGFQYAHSADESFLEFGFDLTKLLGLTPSCPARFGSLQFRNGTGATGENLKDFITPVKLSAGSTCGQLKIVKHDADGHALGGATFRITPDPRPIANPDAYLDVLDNGQYDTDPADGAITVDPVTPGQYTVTEQTPPSGYFKDAQSAPVTVPSSGVNSPAPVFVDGQGSITLHKQGAAATPLGGSTFQLKDHSTHAVLATVADSDNDGTLVFSGLGAGTYDLHESVVPQGYAAVADITNITLSQAHQTELVTAQDPQAKTSLTVHKTDLAGNTPIAGATFDLYRESNGVSGLQTGANGDDSVGFTCTTGSDGYCTTRYTDATWDSIYYWLETSVPWPFTVPNSPDNVFTVPEITQANVDPNATVTVEAHDPMAAISTVASAGTTLNPTATIGDRATVSGIQSSASGSVSFYAFGPGSTCNADNPAASALVGSVNITGPGTYPTDGPMTTTVSKAGTYQWLAVLHIGNDVLAGSCSDTGEQQTVGKATPTLTTEAADTGTVDGTISDVAHLRSFSSPVNGELVHFSVYTSSNCSGAAYWPTTAGAGDVALDANGDAASPEVPVDGTHATYYWKVTYGGDDNNNPAEESCGTPENGEISHAPLIPTPVKAPASGVVSVDGPNNTITYTITVQNTGTATASGVHITDPATDGAASALTNVFAKTTYVDGSASCGLGTSPGCPASISATSNSVSWTTDIAAGGFATVSFTVQVKASDANGDHIYNQAAVGSGNTTLHTNVTDHVVQFPVITAVKSSSPASGDSDANATPVTPGQDITYTVAVHNSGLADATGVPIHDAVPVGTDFVDGSADATGGTFDSASNTVGWVLDVPAGATVSVSFKAHVPDTAQNGTLIDNTATFPDVHTPSDDCLSPSDGSCSTNTTHHEVEFPVLALAKTADPASGSIVQRGSTIHYTVTVTNTGLAPAQGVVVSDTLPAHVTLTDGSSSPAPTTNADGTLTWTVDVPAASGETPGVTTITYAVTVDSDAPQGSTLTNAVLINDQCPGAPADTDPCTTDHHVPTGALTLVKHVDKTTAKYGDTLTYTFDAATTGDLDQTAVVVTDVLPAGTTYVDGSAACTDAGPCTASYDAATRTVTWELGDIAHGAAARHLVFKVTLDQPDFDPTVGLPPATFVNSGVIVSGETTKTPSNEVKTTVVAVLGVKVVRKPVTHPKVLPFTGMGLPPAGAVILATLLIGAGIVLTSVRRRES